MTATVTWRPKVDLLLPAYVWAEGLDWPERGEGVLACAHFGDNPGHYWMKFNDVVQFERESDKERVQGRWLVICAACRRQFKEDPLRAITQGPMPFRLERPKT